ncbi:alanine racemase, partial [Clostridioides difficile]
DKGILKRAIIAIGKQDINIDSLIPIDTDIKILGASSDHMILDVSNTKYDYKLGDNLEFLLTYGGIMSSSTSKYVAKNYSVV